MFPNDVKESLFRGNSTIQLSQNDNLPLSAKMLTFPYREYVIKKIKRPLEDAIKNAKTLFEVAPAIIKAASQLRGKFGDIDKAKTVHPNTQCLKEHKARFIKHERNYGKLPLLTSAYDILIAEVEHDIYYADRLGAEIEWIIEDILAGKWQERTNGHPYMPLWEEDGEYGGKYSIVHKLKKHRHEILKIIGEDL